MEISSFLAIMVISAVQRGVNLFELLAKHQPGVASCGPVAGCSQAETFSQLSSNKFTFLCMHVALIPNLSDAGNTK